MREMTNRIINRIPNFYTREDRSVLVTLIESIVPEIEHLYENTKQVAAMISIDKVYPQDIWKRFGSLFNLYQYSYEDDETYRARVKAVVSIKYGGIKSIIKNTVAGYVGITNTNDIDRGIQIIGAWEYDGPLPDMVRRPGYFLCIIDEKIATRQNIDIVKLNQIINGVKAAGVRVYTTISFEILKEAATITANEQSFDKVVEHNGEENVMLITYKGQFSEIEATTNSIHSLLNSTFMTNGGSAIISEIQSTCEKWWDRFIPKEVMENGDFVVVDELLDKLIDNNKMEIMELLQDSTSYDVTSVNENDRITQSIIDEEQPMNITQNVADETELFISDSDNTPGCKTCDPTSTLNGSFILSAEIRIGSYDIIRKVGN